MTAFEKYDEPQLKVIVKANKQALGKTFKRQAQSIQDALEQMQVCTATMTSRAGPFKHNTLAPFIWHVLLCHLFCQEIITCIMI